MNIALCDDDSQALSFLRTSINTYASKHALSFQLYSYSGMNELLRDDLLLYINIVFLDIYMKDINGMEGAHLLRKKGYTGSIIFTTTSKEHVFESFLVDVTDYLLKPYTYERFAIAMDKATKDLRDKQQFITVMIQGSPVKLLLHEIYYVETGNHCSLIHTKNTILQTSTSISKLEKLVENRSEFFRCQRSFLINMNYVNSINTNTLTMADNTSVLLPIRNMAPAKKKIAQFLWDKAKEDA